MKYSFINGWTKEKTIQAIYEGNNGTKSVGEELCLYRGPNNNKCAIGCFISDDLYSPEMEGIPASDVIERWLLSTVMPLEADAMAALQVAHDTADIGCDTRILLKLWLDENTIE